MGWEITLGDRVVVADVAEIAPGRFVVTLCGTPTEVDARFPEPGVVHIVTGGESFELDVASHEEGASVILYGTRYEVGVVDERRKTLAALGGGGAAGSGDEIISTSMPGKVVALLVAEGDEVAAGQGVVVVEAMKMENDLKSKRGGVVREIPVAVGDTVEAGAKLMAIEALR